MATHQHIKDREPCPFLPPVAKVILPTDIRSIRNQGDSSAFYFACLTCAQSLWLEGKPAQALLQLNHALSLDLDTSDTVITQWPLPYQAKVWIFTRRHEEGFIGNPTRHYQHLASRMSGPRKELRSWRAWACFHLSESVLPAEEFPRDERQIEKDQLRIPSWEKTIGMIQRLGLEGEADLLAMISRTAL